MPSVELTGSVLGGVHSDKGGSFPNEEYHALARWRRGRSLLQVISVLGALAILVAYAANQFGWIDPSRLSYTLANFAGAGILTAVAVVDRQLGFVLLQGGWTLVSLWGIFSVLRGGAREDR